MNKCVGTLECSVHLKLLLCQNAFLMMQNQGVTALLVPRGKRWFHKPAVMFLLSESVVLEREDSLGSCYSLCLLKGSENEVSTYIQVISYPFAPTKLGLHHQSGILPPCLRRALEDMRTVGAQQWVSVFSTSQPLAVTDLTGVKGSSQKHVPSFKEVLFRISCSLCSVLGSRGISPMG